MGNDTYSEIRQNIKVGTRLTPYVKEVLDSYIEKVECDFTLMRHLIHVQQQRIDQLEYELKVRGILPSKYTGAVEPIS